MALCEFGVPSLQAVYDMTWAEFRIRLYGYNRQQEKQWLKVREVAYASIVGPHLDPKKLPTKDKFMPIGKGKSTVTERMKDRMHQAIKEYHKRQKNG